MLHIHLFNVQKERQWKMRRLIKNKKGILGLDNIGSTISTIFSTFPPPVKFLFFMLLITFAVSILSYGFNAFNVFCNSASEPVKIDGLPFTNLDLAFSQPSIEELGQETLPIDSTLAVAKCSVLETEGYYQVTEQGEESDFKHQINDNTWFYQGTVCTNCIDVQVYPVDGGLRYPACLGNVERVRQEDKTLGQKLLCPIAGCQPPEGYVFDYETGLYRCVSNFCKSRTLGLIWDEQLNGRNAKLINPNLETDNFKSDRVIGLTCTDLHPRMAVYGIDFLNFKTFLLLTLLTGLFWMWKHLT